MEISAEKTRLVTNSANGVLREIKVKGQNLGTIQTSSTPEQLFQMTVPNPDVLSRIAQATAAFTKSEANLERLKHISWIKGEADALPCHSYISVCL